MKERAEIINDFIDNLNVSITPEEREEFSKILSIANIEILTNSKFLNEIKQVADQHRGEDYAVEEILGEVGPKILDYTIDLVAPSSITQEERSLLFSELTKVNPDKLKENGFLNYLKDSLQTKTVEEVANELKFEVDKAKAKYLEEQNLKLNFAVVALHINDGVAGKEINEQELTNLVTKYINKHGKPEDPKKFFDNLMHGAKSYEQSLLNEDYEALSKATTEKEKLTISKRIDEVERKIDKASYIAGYIIGKNLFTEDEKQKGALREYEIPYRLNKAISASGLDHKHDKIFAALQDKLLNQDPRNYDKIFADIESKLREHRKLSSKDFNTQTIATESLNRIAARISDPEKTALVDNLFEQAIPNNSASKQKIINILEPHLLKMDSKKLGSAIFKETLKGLLQEASHRKKLGTRNIITTEDLEKIVKVIENNTSLRENDLAERKSNEYIFKDAFVNLQKIKRDMLQPLLDRNQLDSEIVLQLHTHLSEQVDKLPKEGIKAGFKEEDIKKLNALIAQAKQDLLDTIKEKSPKSTNIVEAIRRNDQGEIKSLVDEAKEIQKQKIIKEMVAKASKEAKLAAREDKIEEFLLPKLKEFDYTMLKDPTYNRKLQEELTESLVSAKKSKSLFLETTIKTKRLNVIAEKIDKDRINQLPQFKEIIDARAKDALDKLKKERSQLINKSAIFNDLTEPKKSSKPSLFDDEISPKLKEQDKNLIFQSDKYQKVFADLTTSGKNEPNAQEKTEEQQRHAPSVKELRRNFEMQKRIMGAQSYSSKLPTQKGTRGQ